MKEPEIKSITGLRSLLPLRPRRLEWLNAGGQLFPVPEIETIKNKIKDGSVKSWSGLHVLYSQQGEKYPKQKFQHAIASLSEIDNLDLKSLNSAKLTNLLDEALSTREWMAEEIYLSRAKDYKNPFRKSVYNSSQEMNNVLGKLSKNSFILRQQQELSSFKKEVLVLKKRFGLK